MEEFEFPDEIEAKKTGKADEFDIDVIDDTPEPDKGRQPLTKAVQDPSDAEIESYSANVRTRIKELTHARHDERRAKETTMREKQELENFTQKLLEENQNLKKYADNGNQNMAAHAKGAAEQELANARQRYKTAQEAFDTDAIIEAQEAFTDAKMRLETAKNYRPTPLQVTSDAVQTRQYANKSAEPDEQSLRWQAKNQWFGSDGFEEVTSFALGLHQKLVNSGVDPQSSDYFERIDARMQSTFPEVFGNEKTANSANRRPASVVAPASRSSGVRRVQLTQSALAIAKKFGLTPQQYAAQVAKLES